MDHGNAAGPNANPLAIDSLTINPASSSPHTHTVVFLHGRGDNVHSFSSSLAHFTDSRGRTLAQAFPTFRWVFPQAPVRKCASSPESWPQWFDVWDVKDFSSREELQAQGLKESVPEIRRILGEEAAKLGARWDRVVLAGISMGAATSVHTLFNLDIPSDEGSRLAGYLSFSARCPFTGRSLDGMRQILRLDNTPSHAEVLRRTPMLLEHCVDDPLVLIENGRDLRDVLANFGAKVVWKEYPTGGHWFNSPAGADDVVAFLNRVLTSEAEGAMHSNGMDMS